MSMKQMRCLTEELEDILGDAEIDLDSAVGERGDYEFLLSEKTEGLALMEEELCFLCQLIYNSNVAMPRDGHFTDINPYVPANEPVKGEYEYG